MTTSQDQPISATLGDDVSESDSDEIILNPEVEFAYSFDVHDLELDSDKLVSISYTSCLAPNISIQDRWQDVCGDGLNINSLWDSTAHLGIDDF